MIENTSQNYIHKMVFAPSASRARLRSTLKQIDCASLIYPDVPLSLSAEKSSFADKCARVNLRRLPVEIDSKVDYGCGDHAVVKLYALLNLHFGRLVVSKGRNVSFKDACAATEALVDAGLPYENASSWVACFTNVPKAAIKNEHTRNDYAPAFDRAIGDQPAAGVGSVVPLLSDTLCIVGSDAPSLEKLEVEGQSIIVAGHPDEYHGQEIARVVGAYHSNPKSSLLVAPAPGSRPAIFTPDVSHVSQCALTHSNESHRTVIQVPEADPIPCIETDFDERYLASEIRALEANNGGIFHPEDKSVGNMYYCTDRVVAYLSALSKRPSYMHAWHAVARFVYDTVTQYLTVDKRLYFDGKIVQWDVPGTFPAVQGDLDFACRLMARYLVTYYKIVNWKEHLFVSNTGAAPIYVGIPEPDQSVGGAYQTAAILATDVSRAENDFLLRVWQRTDDTFAERCLGSPDDCARSSTLAPDGSTIIAIRCRSNRLDGTVGNLPACARCKDYYAGACYSLSVYGPASIIANDASRERVDLFPLTISYNRDDGFGHIPGFRVDDLSGPVRGVYSDHYVVRSRSARLGADGSIKIRACGDYDPLAAWRLVFEMFGYHPSAVIGSTAFVGVTFDGELYRIPNGDVFSAVGWLLRRSN